MNRPTQISIAPFTPAIKWIVIVTAACWVGFQLLGEAIFKFPVSAFFALTPAEVLFDFKIWQTLTYMLMHSSQITHILFNMLMLWFFGGELKQLWGSRRFVTYYLLTGFGAAIIYCFGMAAYAYFSGDGRNLIVPVVGASGALYGVMLAYGILFGHRTVYFFMIFPMKARTFVALMGLIEFANMISSQNSGSNVAYLAHLGGLVSGLAIFWLQSRLKNWDESKKAGRKSRHLHLVVNNDKKEDGPKYWN